MDFSDEFLAKIANLSPDQKTIFNRLYRVTQSHGKLKVPFDMKEWVTRTFGSVEEVESQTFIKITNLVTSEGAIFNSLRTKRPVVVDANYGGFKEEIEHSENDHFSEPKIKTPEDIFGRIEGKHCITASNVAKYDGFHGLIIFKSHNPLDFNEEKISDYIEVAKKWFSKANETNPKAVYPLFGWNCLWKSAASITHGHAQLVLTEGMAFSKVDLFRKQVLEYENDNLSNYFDDLFNTHKALGLALDEGENRILARITPVKNNEVMILSKTFGNGLARSIDFVLKTLTLDLGVQSFNLIAYLLPLKKTEENWSHLPIVVKVVDRGKLSERTADIGFMELYAQSVVESNPYNFIKAISKRLKK